MRVTDRLVIPDAELREAFVRSGGPGGQNVNRVATKVELRWAPGESEALGALRAEDRAWLLRRLQPRLTDGGELIVTSSRTRDQSRNRRDARDKLAATVAAALERPRRRKPTRPSRAAKERRLQQKKVRAERKKSRRGVEP